MSERYRKSEALLARALQTVPLGCQTFSKSVTQYPLGVSPLYVERGQGGRVWDVDGNEFIDFVNALAAITLGYNDPDVVLAVKSQLDAGTIFSLSHRLEVEVAEQIVSMVPCAEMVRFGKNGSDATAGAIRLARAYTGREHVAVCGYHGWQDWYIGSTARYRGVPEATRKLTHTFWYNDLLSLEKLFAELHGGIAAVILEPMNITEPAHGFLEAVKTLAHREGALLIFDETVTGFRFAKGGAQELFGITPDLATFGKGLANGYPISAVAGKAEIMHLMEDIFFSFTFGGETLSLAAARATLNKLTTQPVIDRLYAQGSKVRVGLQELLVKHDAGHLFSISGNPVWSFFIIKDVSPYSQWEIKTLYLQEMFARGILTLGSHNMSFAHTDNDITLLLSSYDEVIPLLRDAVTEHRLHEWLRCKPLEPLFKVR